MKRTRQIRSNYRKPKVKKTRSVQVKYYRKATYPKMRKIYRKPKRGQVVMLQRPKSRILRRIR